MSSTRSLIVDASGATAGSYKTIESALEKIPHGGSILVKPGIYRESVSLNSHVQLIAESGAVIQATDGPALHLTADSVTEISGFELIADTVSEVCFFFFFFFFFLIYFFIYLFIYLFNIFFELKFFFFI